VCGSVQVIKKPCSVLHPFRRERDDSGHGMSWGLCAEMRSGLFVEIARIETAPEPLDCLEPASDYVRFSIVIVGQEPVQNLVSVSVAGTFPLADSASGNLEGNFLL